MLIWDEAKRQKTLAERGLDFADAAKVFAGRTASLRDDRRDYGEKRFITVGWLNDRFVVITWTTRGEDTRIVSMRYGHADEETYYFGEVG